MFGAEAPCTVPAQVAALEQAGNEAAEAAAALVAGVGIDEVDRRGSVVAAAAATGAALSALFDDDRSATVLSRLPDVVVTDLRSRTVTVNERLAGAVATVQEVRFAEMQRVEAERVAADAVAAQAVADEAARQARAAADAKAAQDATAAAAQAEAEQEAEAPAASSAYYPNCDAVRAAGADPIYAGDPGYSGKLDRDGDGVACEK